MTKKLIPILVMILLATAVQAGILDGVVEIGSGFSDAFGNSRSNVANADTGIRIYDNNKNFIDFTVMFILFMSLAYLGLKRFMGDDGKGGNAAKGLAFAVGLALSIAAMKAGVSPSFFIPFVKNALFLIVFLVIFMLLRSDTMLGKERTIMALVLALAICWASFNVYNIVADPEKKFDITDLWATPTATRVDNLAVEQSLLKDKVGELGIKYQLSDAELNGDFKDLTRILKAKIRDNRKGINPKDPNAKKKYGENTGDRELLASLETQFNIKRDQILNTKLKLEPTTPGKVRILQSKPGPNDDISCSTSGSDYNSRDGEKYIGEMGYVFIWSDQDGTIKTESLSKSQTSTLPASDTDEGDRITCTVYAEIRHTRSKPGTATVNVRSSAVSDKNDDARTKFAQADRVANTDDSTSDQIRIAMSNIATLKTNGQTLYKLPQLDDLYGRLQGQLDNIIPTIQLEISPDPQAFWDSSKKQAKARITYSVTGGRSGMQREIVFSEDAGDVSVLPLKGSLSNGETVDLIFKKKGIYHIKIKAIDGSHKPVYSNEKEIIVDSESAIRALTGSSRTSTEGLTTEEKIRLLLK